MVSVAMVIYLYGCVVWIMYILCRNSKKLDTKEIKEKYENMYVGVNL